MKGSVFIGNTMQQNALTPVWREKFQVRSWDIGLNAMMRLSSVCSYFQEIAGKHATHLGLGYHYMQQSGRVWVLSKLFMNIERMPAWGQEFYAETWPVGIERIFFRRDYRLDDGKSNLISACSYWLLLDLSTHRPTVVQIDEEVLRSNKGRYAMIMPSDVFPAVASDTSEIHRVVYSDLDQNRHVNNARYVEWIYDQLDQDLLQEKSPSCFSIEYKHEAKAGDLVALRKDKLTDEKTSFAVEGKLSGDNRVCFRSKIVF